MSSSSVSTINPSLFDCNYFKVDLIKTGSNPADVTQSQIFSPTTLDYKLVNRKCDSILFIFIYNL